MEQQVKSELVGRAIQQFQKESEPRMLGDPSLEIIEFSEKSAFQFILRIEIEPEFDMPEYKGLKVKRETRLATGDLVKEAIREMRGESSAFVEVSRPSRKGDMIFLDGSATCEGRPLAEVLPGLKNRPSLETIAFVAGESSGRFPDLGEHLLGVVQGQSLELSLPVSEEVAGSGGSGKTVDFQLTVRGVEEPVAPELDADFARSKGHASMEELEEDVRRTLQGEFDQLSRESVREQLRAQLLSRIDCDYPDDVLERLTKEFVFRLVEFNLEEGGVSDALLQQHKGGIYTSAQRMAREHLKLMAAMPRIAKAEGIDASEEEVGSWDEGTRNQGHARCPRYGPAGRPQGEDLGLHRVPRRCRGGAGRRTRRFRGGGAGDGRIFRRRIGALPALPGRAPIRSFRTVGPARPG